MTVQAQILGLMKELKNKLTSSIQLMAQDLGVVAEMADDVLVACGCLPFPGNGPTIGIHARPARPTGQRSPARRATITSQEEPTMVRIPRYRSIIVGITLAVLSIAHIVSATPLSRPDVDAPDGRTTPNRRSPSPAVLPP